MERAELCVACNKYISVMPGPGVDTEISTKDSVSASKELRV